MVCSPDRVIFEVATVSTASLKSNPPTAAASSVLILSEDHIWIDVNQRDWTRFQWVVLWVYSQGKGGRLTIDAVTHEDHYFEAWNNVDWVGWKEVRIPFQGKKARFRTEGRPRWERIDGIRIWKDEGRGVDIVIDDIRLERP